MENKVIAKEYVDKNYIHKDEIKQIIEELRYYVTILKKPNIMWLGI